MKTERSRGEPWDPARGNAEGRGLMPSSRVLRAMWAGDLDTLNELAGCGCCCDEHFFEHCPARAWGGCRGQESLTRGDYAAWEAHYHKHHGLSRDEFYGVETKAITNATTDSGRTA